MIKEEERDFKPTSRGEGRCNRFLEWLEINVTRWNRKKPVFYLPEKYINYYIGVFVILSILSVFLTLYGIFTNNTELLNIVVFYLLFPMIYVFVFTPFMFFILVTFRRVRFSPYNPLETPLPV